MSTVKALSLVTVCIFITAGPTLLWLNASGATDAFVTWANKAHWGYWAAFPFLVLWNFSAAAVVRVIYHRSGSIKALSQRMANGIDRLAGYEK